MTLELPDVISLDFNVLVALRILRIFRHRKCDRAVSECFNMIDVLVLINWLLPCKLQKTCFQPYFLFFMSRQCFIFSFCRSWICSIVCLCKRSTLVVTCGCNLYIQKRWDLFQNVIKSQLFQNTSSLIFSLKNFEWPSFYFQSSSILRFLLSMYLLDLGTWKFSGTTNMAERSVNVSVGNLFGTS